MHNTASLSLFVVYPVAKVNGHYEFLEKPEGVSDKTVNGENFWVRPVGNGRFVAQRKTPLLVKESDLWAG